MSIHVIVHGNASAARKHENDLPHFFAERHIAIEHFVVAPKEKHVRRAAEHAVKAGAGAVIVAGGDGSMTTVCDVLAGTSTILGVLPLGTGNSFAQTLGLPLDLAAALDVIAAGRHTRVDLGIVNGTHFANFATIGLSSEIADNVPKILKPIVGRAAYAVGGITPMLAHKAFRARVRSNEGKREFVAQQILVANGRYFGSQPVLPNATIRDGKLALYASPGSSLLHVAETYVAMFFGKQTMLPGSIAITSEEIVIKTKPKQLVSIDGSAFGKTPVRFSIARKALRVFVGEAFADAPE